MATVAHPASVANGAYAQESDQQSELAPPRFTAVNGKDATNHSSQTATTPANSLPHGHGEGDTGSAGAPAVGGVQDGIQRETTSLASGAERVDEQGLQESSSLQMTPGGTNKNKRKRSESLERQSQQHDVASDMQANSARASVMDPDMHARFEVSNGGKQIAASHEQPDPSSTGYIQPEIRDAQPINETTGGSWQDYNSHLISQAQKAQNLDTSDAQLVEALQRETHSAESVEQKPWSTGPPSLTGETMSPYLQDKSQPPVQVGPKRKRVFSNRTKTGCLTCRRRKKKCDEQHPACNNCLRGGFVCEGYSSRSTWQKPSNSKAPVPLQSKDGYPEAATQYLQEVNARHHERIQTAAQAPQQQQQQQQQVEVPKARPVGVEENDNVTTQYLGTPTSVAGNRNAWPTKRNWPAAPHPPYMPEHMAKTSDYREVPPIHELSRDGQTKTDYNVVPPIREFSQQGPHSKSGGIPMFQGAVDQRPSHSGALDTNSPQAQARLALSIEHQLSTRHKAGEDTERDKMVHGELYRPFDMQLVEDRDRCKSALWRYNNACNPSSGVSSKEQNRLLREVIIPSNTSTSSGSPTPRPSGSIGQGAVVEAPFRCHYGFNIHIGEDVMISENCCMIDDCPINIGAHTWIGPNVTILGSMAHANMQERKGSQSRYQGRPVTIEEDCYVGANCTIYPGVRLRRGAYVAPGEVVKSDIVAYGFQGLKPSYM